MQTLGKVAALIAIAGVLCGFDNFNFEYQLSAFRGEPVRHAVARLGRPIARSFLDGRTIYYWRVGYFGDGGSVCKIWGSAQRNIIMNWGYQGCASSD